MRQRVNSNLETPKSGIIPAVERVPVSDEEMRKYAHEEDFNELSVKLMVEFCEWVCIAACLLPGDTHRWTRDQAIVGGLMVRLYKLTSALLDQTCQHRREIAFALGRLAVECMINIQYLLTKNSEEIYRAYVVYSFRHERRLRERIERNIKARNGVVLPVERRMMNSIDKSLENSGLRFDDITKEAWLPWKRVDLFRRAEAVGLGEGYLYIFAGPSHSIHGNWQDLLEYHIETVEGGFTPHLDWHHPRPQLLLAIGLIGVEAVKAYFSHITGHDAHEVLDRLDDLSARLRLANSAHESFLSSR